MMQESDSKRLFHFTKEFKTLKSIIQNCEFQAWYSLENFDFLNETDLFDEIRFENIQNENLIKDAFAYPMVCFCDIPIDKRIYNHAHDEVGGYGKFGIGMKKCWARKKCISPVSYVPINSMVAKFWYEMLTRIPYVRSMSKEPKALDGFLDYMINMGTFIKPYDDDTKIYYNEREWRYYPPLKLFGEIEQKRFLTKSEYISLKSRESMIVLEFSIKKDVDCIVVPKENLIETRRLVGDLVKILPYEKLDSCIYRFAALMYLKIRRIKYFILR